ncbi:MAG: 2-phospho-L-lactate guanylyltransferase [Acidimicrobiales bacterium]|nr:2-phospho-L-lactate guanylyltransferase [Acidimicrobiales bacterium]
MPPPPAEPATGLPPTTAVLLPVKAFGSAKGRLDRALANSERAALAERLATLVAQAANDLPVVVVTDDDAVARWTDRMNARLIWRPARGLNDAVAHGVSRLATEGIDRVVVAHADIPRAHDLDRVGDFAGITLVPDRHRDGTNVIALPTRSGFRFAYGPGSFARHLLEAERVGLPRRLYFDDDLAWDVDTPDDLSVLEAPKNVVTKPQDAGA